MRLRSIACKRARRTSTLSKGFLRMLKSTVERSGADSLTPSERRVAELAASGQTNREIAQTLFVTEKTVEAHLGRAFRKLDVNSRRQLPDVLASVTGYEARTASGLLTAQRDAHGSMF